MNFRILLCLACAATPAWAHLGRGSAFDTTEPALERAWTARMLGEKATPSSIQQHRSLVATAPTRQCGEVIAKVPLEHVKELEAFIVDAFFGPGAPGEGFGSVIAPVFNESLKYAIEVSVVCASCDEVKSTYAGSAFLTDEGPHGFLSYCGEGVYGADLTYSGLLMQPIDPATDEVFASKMKGSVFMHRTLPDRRGTPSEVWPENLSEFISSKDEFQILTELYDVLSAGMAAASGAIAIAPDYIGFGQAYLSPISYGVVNLYQQATIPLYLQAQKAIVTATGGCTELGNTATFGGYSEGGFSSVAAALAFDRLDGYEVINVASGGAPLKIVEQLQWSVDQYDQGRPEDDIGLAQGLIFSGNSFSSTNPDLANSGTGQDLLADEWMDEDNYAMNVKAWLAEDITQTELEALIPFPYVPEIFRSEIVSLMQEATMMNSSDPCSLAGAGVTDKICEALQDNELFQATVDTTFPIVICHSPDDDVVPFFLSPNTTTNENLSTFAIGALTASGTHVESSGPCLFSTFYPYLTAWIGPDANEMAPIDGQCVPPTGTPTTDPPTGGPTSEASHILASLALAVSTMLSAAFIW